MTISVISFRAVSAFSLTLINVAAAKLKMMIRAITVLSVHVSAFISSGRSIHHRSTPKMIAIPVSLISGKYTSDVQVGVAFIADVVVSVCGAGLCAFADPFVSAGCEGVAIAVMGADELVCDNVN